MLPAHIAATLPDFIAARAAARGVRVLSVERLGGGAIQDNFALEVEIDGGELCGRQALVLRTDAPSAVAVSHSRRDEFALLRFVFDAGIRVPEPLWCAHRESDGAEFFLMRRVAGSADGAHIVRTLGGTPEGEALAERLAGELARLHDIGPPRAALAFLAEAPANPALARVALYRRYLDALAGDPRVAIEYALAWLERNAPQTSRVTLCHCDLRTGNYLVEDNRLSAILDWEFAAWSDPLEDLGWFCARAWRFGNWHLEAGGLTSAEHFCRAYERAAGRTLARDALDWWQVMAAVRWAIIALQQAERHSSGVQPSLALALTGRMVPEMEYDMLALIERIERRGAGG